MANVNLTPSCDATSFASSSTSPSHANTNSYVYDVFINHRGPDVKKGLASHLYRRLKACGLKVFLDQQELEEGESMTPQIEGAIRTASVHIAIFSPRYAESRYCLEELVMMLETRSTIIPVFYHVSPSELRWTRGEDGLYARALRILRCILQCKLDESGVYARALCMLAKKTTVDARTNQKKPRHEPNTIEKWRETLSAVAGKSGFELNACNDGDEGQLVDEVVQQVLKKVWKPPLDVAKYPTGLLEKVEQLEMTLQRQSRKPNIVAIVGLGGIGKTTLAREFVNRQRSKYTRFCFLYEVRSKSLRSLLSSLLKDLTQSDVQINGVDEGKEKLKSHLSSHKAFIVLDDVDHSDQLDALLFPIKDVIHRDSLILITSRNKDVFTTNSEIVESSIYTLNGLNREQSRELFCYYAFGRSLPVVGFNEVVERFLDACKGLPLSLKVLGELLHGKYDLKYWNEQLQKTSKVLPSAIQRTLQISYDALDREEKQIFLDIACFFIGEDRDTAIKIWEESGWSGELGLWKLENRCLVEVDSENSLRMHDHIRDLGRYMANSEYPCRLWRLTEDLLHNVSKRSHVRGISVVHENSPEQSFENLSTSCCNLSKLQLLRAEGYIVERIFSVGELPKLIYLRWENCPSSSLPLPFSIRIKNLKVLYINGENLKTLWQDESQAPLLLRELHIVAPLSQVPESIGKLKHLQSLDLHGCYTLQTLPDSVGKLTGLQSLDLRGCFALQTLPDSVDKLNLLFCHS